MRAIPRSLLILVSLLTLLASAGVSLGQTPSVRDWNRVDDIMQGGIGLHYGKLGGNGLAFRLPLTWYVYLQAGGGIWHTSDNKHHNLALQLNYILRQDSKLRLYLAGGLGYFYHNERIGTEPNPDVWKTDKVYNLGAGVGVEYLLSPRVSLQGELDFVHESDSGDITVAPQVGLYYYW